jgi:acetyl esterase
MPQPAPEMQAVLERLAAQRAGLPERYELPYPAARAQLLAERRPWLHDGPACPHEERRLEVDGRAVAVRVYRPDIDAQSRTLVYLHGGGWCVGSAETHDNIVRRLAVGLGAETWSVEYALAPEQPYPAAAHDAVAAIRAVARERRGTRLVVAGDSAGAHLALDAALRLRTAGASPIAALVLLYGVYTRSLDDASMAAYGDGRYGLSRAAQMRYLADTFGGADASREPPRFGLDAELDVAGLPPVLVVAAELDILHDQSEAFASRLAHAGVPVDFVDVRGVTHGFLSYGRLLPQARDTLAAAAAWCRRSA